MFDSVFHGKAMPDKPLGLREGDVCVRRYFDGHGWPSRLVVVTEVGEDHVCGMSPDGMRGDADRTVHTWRWTPEQFVDRNTEIVTEELAQLQEVARAKSEL